MVIEKKQSTAFERYLERTMPPWMQESASVPATWEGDAEEWRAYTARLREAAHRGEKLELLRDFCRRIAEKEEYTHEAVSGVLDLGAERLMMQGGRVKRPAPSTVPVELHGQARGALRELESRGLSLFPSLDIALRQAAGGSYTSDMSTLKGALREAEAAWRRFDAEQEARRQDVAAWIPVTVAATSQGKVGPLQLKAGHHTLTADEIARHRSWEQEMENAAGARGQEFPEGFNWGNWPPLTVLES